MTELSQVLLEVETIKDQSYEMNNKIAVGSITRDQAKTLKSVGEEVCWESSKTGETMCARITSAQGTIRATLDSGWQVPYKMLTPRKNWIGKKLPKSSTVTVMTPDDVRKIKARGEKLCFTTRRGEAICEEIVRVNPTTVTFHRGNMKYKIPYKNLLLEKAFATTETTARKGLETNASFEDAIDVFKYVGRKYHKDLEMGWNVPAKAKDYKHVCRFPYKETAEFFKNNYRNPGSLWHGSISTILGARTPRIKDFKQKYCSARATRLTEPDLVCLPERGSNKAECRFLKENRLEVQFEIDAKWSWVSPYRKPEMVPQQWRDLIYSEVD